MHGRAKHDGCRRNGWLTHRVEPMFGLSVEECTGCAHRRVIVATVAKPTKNPSKKQREDKRTERSRERVFLALPIGPRNAVRIGVLAAKTGLSQAGANRAVNGLLARRKNVRYTNVQRVGRGPGQRTVRVYWRDGGPA